MSAHVRIFLSHLDRPALPALAGAAPLAPRVCKNAFLGPILVMAVGLWMAVLSLRVPAAEDESRRDRYGDPLPPGAIARLGTLRFRVDDEIVGLAFAPDGKTIAVRGRTSVWLLDAVSGKQLRRVDTSGSENPHIAFSPDGKRLVAAAQTTEKDPVRPVRRIRPVVRVWETASGRKVKEFALNDARWLGWSAEGQPLAAYESQGEMRLRNLATSDERRFTANGSPRFTIFCTVAKNVLAACDAKGQIHIWDLASGERRCVLKTGDVHVRSPALSPNGRWLASLTLGAARAWSVRLWDTATGAVVHRIAAEQKHIDEVVFSPDGKTLATVGTDEIRFCDVITGRERSRIHTQGWTRRTAAFSPDGQTMATAEQNSEAIHLCDVVRGTRKGQPEGHAHHPLQAAFSPDGRRVATGAFWGGSIRLWDSGTGEPLVRIQRDSWVDDCAFSADGRTLLSCCDGKLLFFDAATGRETQVVKIEDPDRPKAQQSASNLYISDDRARLLVSSYNATQREELITGWDVATRKQLFHRRSGLELHPVKDYYAVSADARMLIAPYPALDATSRELAARRGKPIEQTMRLEDAATGKPLLTFPRPKGETWPLAFSPDGRLLVSNTLGPLPQGPGGWGHTLRLWEVLTATELLSMPAPTNHGFMKAAFAPDGRLLALSAPSTEILLWDVRRGKELRRFKDFGAQATSLAFSPDGRRLVSGLSDSTLLVWDVGAASACPVEKLGANAAAKAWADLSRTDAPRAFRARASLASAPEEAIALLKEQLHPVQAPVASRLRRLLAEMDSEQFAVREKAQGELEKIGELAEPALRQTLGNKPTLEVRRRVQAILERLHGPVTQPQLLQALRAVAMLEDIGTPEARRLLEKLATGVSKARLTCEAKESLRRLDLRHSSGR